jgi:hypothetical protein
MYLLSMQMQERKPEKRGFGLEHDHIIGDGVYVADATSNPKSSPCSHIKYVIEQKGRTNGQNNTPS